MKTITRLERDLKNNDIEFIKIESIVMDEGDDSHLIEIVNIDFFKIQIHVSHVFDYLRHKEMPFPLYVSYKGEEWFLVIRQ